jgi:hypothetical protein
MEQISVRIGLCLLAIACFCACGSPAAAEQPADELQVLASRREPALETVRVCVGVFTAGATIVVGPLTPDPVGLTLDHGGRCEGYASPSMLLAEASQGFLQVRSGCFFFRLRAANLHPSLDNAARWRDAGAPTGVRVGPLTFTTNEAGYFDLRTPSGKRAAERWVLGTLAAVRGCWDRSETSGSPRLVDRLYANVGLKQK